MLIIRLPWCFCIVNEMGRTAQQTYFWLWFMLQGLKHPAVHPVPLPEVTLLFSLVSYWTLNLPDFTAWHLNVNCVLWLFMLMCNAVKSSSMSLLLISVLAEGWGKQLGSAQWSCTWGPDPVGTYVLLKWQMWLRRTASCCVLVSSGIRAAALHKKRLWSVTACGVLGFRRT